ncbi:MAG: DNA photolyase family protein [Hyphomonadaceae bacterium]|nr:DNA photolyase family protein [Hyphomonadaceae bacterium]
MQDTLQIVWFKRDLRTHDHRALVQAARRGPVLPLYIAEPEYWQLPDASGRQWAFVAESLEELRQDLARLGQPLVVRTGDVVEVLERARRQLGPIALWSHEETGNGWTYQRDLRVVDWARQAGVEWTEVRQSGVIRRLKSRNGWAKRWDAFMAEPEAAAPRALAPLPNLPLGEIPTAQDLDLASDPCPGRQRGGRAAGLETLQSFLHVRGAPYRKAMSSPSAGAEHCSRLSPHLAWGTLSMRETAQAGWARQRQLKADGIKGGWRGSMSSFQGRLHWRDHFTQKLEDEPEIEVCNLHAACNGLRPREPDAARLEAWCKGETGLPFVDACMRALNATGWMNFRMRAMLMAVSSYHLWLDWRQPGEHLARQFTDYEPGIHWPQVQMQSGTTGINTIRIYNPVKQGHDQDPDGAFIRRWLPELAGVPEAHIHEPWTWEGAGGVLGKVYPMPIVDHLEAARSARQKVWAVRKGSGFRQTANAIQDKHGSRKSGIPMRGQRRKPQAAESQLSLPLGGDKAPS